MTVPTISKADLARLVSMSKPAISKAVAAGHIVVDAEGHIDTDLPVNAGWIATKRAGIRQPTRAAVKKAPPSPEAPEAADEDADLDSILELQGEKLRLTKARREQAEADTHLKNLRIAREKRELIPRDLERRKWSAFDAALKTNLRDLPRRNAARLHALALAEGAHALEAALEAEISSSLARVVEAAKEGGLAE